MSPTGHSAAALGARRAADRRSALHAAVSRDNDAAVRRRIALGANVNARETFEITPLHSIEQYTPWANLALLCEAGADSTLTDADGLTPLDIARRVRDWDVVRYLKWRERDG